jgi:alpha-L-rhamnosidase
MKMRRYLQKSLITCLFGFIILSFFILGLSCSQNKQEARAPRMLQTESQTNPQGIDTPLPRFSWQVNDQRRNARQAAYQVLVATNPDLLQDD